jgi:hypothetical protein
LIDGPAAVPYPTTIESNIELKENYAGAVATNAATELGKVTAVKVVPSVEEYNLIT